MNCKWIIEPIDAVHCSRHNFGRITTLKYAHWSVLRETFLLRRWNASREGRGPNGGCSTNDEALSGSLVGTTRQRGGVSRCCGVAKILLTVLRLEMPITSWAWQKGEEEGEWEGGSSSSPLSLPSLTPEVMGLGFTGSWGHTLQHVMYRLRMQPMQHLPLSVRSLLQPCITRG